MFSTKIMTTLGAAIGAVALAGSAQAATIMSYDITNAQTSGYGGWAHTYSGTITGPSGSALYTGGSGTLNDGSAGTSEQDTQLFYTLNAPTITVFLSNATTISTIDVLAGLFPNAIPGNLKGFTVTIGANSAAYTTTGFGALESNGYYQNQRVTLTGLLASTATSSFTLSNFVADNASGFGNNFAIGELAVDGRTVDAVPEPATWAMMIGGFGMVGASMRYRRRKTSVSFG